MAATPPKKQNATDLPWRGRVKAQIFKSLTGNLSSAAAKALARVKWSPSAPTAASSSASTSGPTSTSTSPPPSAYASDGYPDQA